MLTVDVEVKRVHSIPLIALILGNRQLAANYASSSLGSTPLFENLNDLVNVWMLPSHTAGLVELGDDWQKVPVASSFT